MSPARARMVLGSICAFVNSHCSSRARCRSNPSLIGAWTRRLIRLARKDNCISSSRSKRRPRNSARKRHNSRRVAALSKVINSISGSISLISLASTLPMIQVNRVSGQAAWKARSAASAWQVSPIAERRSRHTCCGGGLKLKVVIRMIKGGQRIATATGVMLADPHSLGNAQQGASEALFDPDFWAARGELAAVSGGRGSAWFVGSSRPSVGAAALPPRRLHGANFARSVLVVRRRIGCAHLPSGACSIIFRSAA